MVKNCNFEPFCFLINRVLLRRELKCVCKQIEIPYLQMVLLSIFFNKLPWPITRIIKSPAPSDETQQSVSVIYNEESAIEL